MNTILRKLTTKPVWWLETRRPYPIREAWTRLPPIEAPNGPVIFAVLATPGTFNDALWTAWSWLRFLGAAVRLEIYVDGPVDDPMRRSLETLLPGANLFEAARALQTVGGIPPHVASFIQSYPLGRKFGLHLALQQRDRILFCDADVLAFAPPVELLEIMTSSAAGAYLCEEKEGNFAPELVARARQIGIPPLVSLNSGLLLIPQNSLSLERADELLRDWPTLPPGWFLEQTAIACLLSSAPMTPLPRERYVLTAARQFYWEHDVDYSKIVARHFTTPTRHVMYAKAMPSILRSLVNEGKARASSTPIG